MNITIRNLDDRVEARLRQRAARNNRSIEDEARHILDSALPDEFPAPDNLADAIMRRMRPVGGVDLDIPPRTLLRESIDLDR